MILILVFVIAWVFSSCGDDDGDAGDDDNNETHPDGFVTVRTGQDTTRNGTELTEAMFVTNHYRKRYDAPSCWRYESMVDTVETLAPKQSPVTLTDLHEVICDVELGRLTVNTIRFKPSDWTLKVFRGGPDRLASQDAGVVVPPEALFPW